MQSLLEVIYMLGVTLPFLIYLAENSLKYHIVLHSVKREELDRFLKDLKFPSSFLYSVARKFDTQKDRDYLHIVNIKKSTTNLFIIRMFAVSAYLAALFANSFRLFTYGDTQSKFSSLLYIIFTVPAFLVAWRFGHGIVRYMDTSTESQSELITNDEQ